jgi:hypothetical protein
MAVMVTSPKWWFFDTLMAQAASEAEVNRSKIDAM